MIIDLRAGTPTSSPWEYAVVDATTGERLDHLRIWYADDEAGVIKTYKADANGLVIFHGQEPETEEFRRPIRILCLIELEPVPRQETWRDRKPML